MESYIVRSKLSSIHFLRYRPEMPNLSFFILLLLWEQPGCGRYLLCFTYWVRSWVLWTRLLAFWFFDLTMWLQLFYFPLKFVSISIVLLWVGCFLVVDFCYGFRGERCIVFSFGVPLCKTTYFLSGSLTFCCVWRQDLFLRRRLFFLCRSLFFWWAIFILRSYV